MKKFLGIAVQLIIGGAVGAIGAALIDRYLPAAETAWIVPLTILSCVVSYFLHIILHEGGHLVCGLLSGYRFVSFRIGSRILIKSKGRYCLKKFNIPGTGGQCLLDPPDVDARGDFPAKLYNLGGGLSNLLFSAVALVLVEATGNPVVAMVLLPFALLGTGLGLLNLIPLKVSGIANDGYNLLSLDKDVTGKKALWQQLRVNKLQSDGVRLKDMDESLFDCAFEDTVGNPLVDQMKLFWMQRLIDEKRFEEARTLGECLVMSNTLELLKNMARVELLFLELIGPCRENQVKRLYNKTVKKWLKAVKGYPSTHRVKYAYAVRFAHNDKMAAKAKRNFAKVCKTYPMLGEIETEKVLFEEI